MKNLKEFKELIERYETITIGEIRKEWKDIKAKKERRSAHYVAQSLTGFGGSRTCTLCVAIDQRRYNDCNGCVYFKNYKEGFGCINTINEPSYRLVDYAETPTQLLKAYRNRAKHLRETYKEIL